MNTDDFFNNNTNLTERNNLNIKNIYIYIYIYIVYFSLVQNVKLNEKCQLFLFIFYFSLKLFYLK